ncbi:CbtA family protein [Roseivivax sp.]
MFTRILTSALFAGAAAGLIAALLQLVFVQPVLLHAELYEGGELVHFGPGGEANSARPALGGFDALRDGLSIIFTMLIYAGYALVLIPLMALAQERGAQINARSGLLWGAAGFVTVHMAPAFGLPPEVPGVAAADLMARQLWWGATVLATGIGLWLAAFGRSWAAWGGAVVLLLAPHLVGAPSPEVFSGPVPTELGALFAARALGTGLAAWVLLGGFAGFFWARETQGQGAAQTA